MKSNNMKGKVILTMSQEEFDAMIAMIEDNAIMLQTAEDEFSKPTMKNLKLFNKMLKKNKINKEIIH